MKYICLNVSHCGSNFNFKELHTHVIAYDEGHLNVFIGYFFAYLLHSKGLSSSAPLSKIFNNNYYCY